MKNGKFEPGDIVVYGDKIYCLYHHNVYPSDEWLAGNADGQRFLSYNTFRLANELEKQNFCPLPTMTEVVYATW